MEKHLQDIKFNTVNTIQNQKLLENLISHILMIRRLQYIRSIKHGQNIYQKFIEERLVQNVLILKEKYQIMLVRYTTFYVLKTMRQYYSGLNIMEYFLQMNHQVFSVHQRVILLKIQNIVQNMHMHLKRILILLHYVNSI